MLKFYEFSLTTYMWAGVCIIKYVTQRYFMINNDVTCVCLTFYAFKAYIYSLTRCFILAHNW